MIAFIDDHRATYGFEPICKVLPIAPSTYRAHAARRADPGRRPARARSDAALMVEIGRARHQLLVFLAHTGSVEPTNNGSEKLVRPSVVQRKVTNGYRAMWAA